MVPLCPNCRGLMVRAETSRNAFACVPCRELIQFFDVGVTEDHTQRFRERVIQESYPVGMGA